MPKIKIKRKGLPKYQQQQGTVTNTGGPIIVMPSMTLPPNYVPLPEEAPAEYFQQQNSFDVPDTRSLQEQAVALGHTFSREDPQNYQTLYNIPDPKKRRTPNPLAASLAVGLLGRFGDILTKNKNENAALKAARKQGMSDSAYGPMRNVYSRGRTPEGYAYNMMVPIQFAGPPSPELYGQPQTRRYQEGGINITRDVLGLPDLYPVAEAPLMENVDIPMPPPMPETGGREPGISTPEQLYENTNRVLGLPKKGGQISYTHNNPLNVHYGKFARQYGGQKGASDSDGNVAIFPDLQIGIKANTDLLFGPSYSSLTISKARNRWVNGDKDVPTPSSRDIVRAMGKDVPLNQLTPQEKDKLFKLFARFEGKQAYNLIKDVQIFEEGGEIDNDTNENDMRYKVRITKTPEMKHGGQHLGDQQNYGLYRGGGYLQDYVTGTEVPDPSDIRSVYPEEPSEDTANVEVEKGEMIKDSQGLYKVGGKKHSQGGTKANVEEGAYVFSDYISVNPMLGQALNLTSNSSKKKDNTVAKLLGKKVDAKDYNRLKEIISSAQAGKDVDPFELKTAQNRMADYDKYISRAALAGELSKAMEGKPFQIPEIGIPALQELTGQTRDNYVSEEPMAKARYGMQYMADGATVDPPAKKIKKEELDSYIKQGFKQDPKNPNRYYKEGTPGSKGVKQVTVMTPGKLNPVRKAIPGGQADWRWEKWIIDQLKNGVPIEDLVDAGHGTLEGLGKYRKYYVPIAPKVDIVPEEYDIPGTPPESVYFEDQPKTTITTTLPPDFVYQRPPGTRPYLQDALNLMDVQSRYYTDIPPTRVSTGAAYIDPAFLQPNYFPTQSVAAQASRDAALYGRGAQSQSSILQNIQNSSLPSMGQLQTAIGAQNVATDMGARQFNAQVYNQNQAQNAALRKQYLDEVAQFIWNKDTSRIQKNTAAKNAINQGITNWGNTKLMNQRFPQMAFDPLTYNVFYKPSSGEQYGSLYSKNSGMGYGDSAQWNAIYQKEYDALTNLKDPKRREEQAIRMANLKTGMPSGNSRASQQQMMMMQQMGAYANPYYRATMNPYMMDPFANDDYTFGS